MSKSYILLLYYYYLTGAARGGDISPSHMLFVGIYILFLYLYFLFYLLILNLFKTKLFNLFLVFIQNYHCLQKIIILN